MTIKIKEKKGVAGSKRRHFLWEIKKYIIPHLSTKYWLYLLLQTKL
jgi:hypothetical protein